MHVAVDRGNLEDVYVVTGYLPFRISMLLDTPYQSISDQLPTHCRTAPLFPVNESYGSEWPGVPRDTTAESSVRLLAFATEHSDSRL